MPSAVRRAAQIEKRRRIFDAAVEVFADKGFESARMADIASAAGVAEGTIYLYFKSKDDLLRSLFREKMAEVLRRFHAMLAAPDAPEDKLRRYVEERTAMVAAIAHDLRTPLTRMRFRIENAQPEIRDKVAADIEQMDGMVSQALTFVRGDTARGVRVKLDLGALLQSVTDDLAEMGAEASFDGGQLVIEGDPIGLRRVVTNLVENAVKFGQKARVSLLRDGDSVLVRVEDDGPGLADSEIERVFEPFYRVDPSRAPATGGFGLGLSVARSIARAHGGEVTLANREAGGLIATVRLPA